MYQISISTRLWSTSSRISRLRSCTSCSWPLSSHWISSRSRCLPSSPRLCSRTRSPWLPTICPRLSTRCSRLSSRSWRLLASWTGLSTSSCSRLSSCSWVLTIWRSPCAWCSWSLPSKPWWILPTPSILMLMIDKREITLLIKIYYICACMLIINNFFMQLFYLHVIEYYFLNQSSKLIL